MTRWTVLKEKRKVFNCVIVGLRLTQSVSRAVEVLLKAAAFYSDSRDDLWWIHRQGRDFGLFVGFAKYKCTLIQLNGSTFPLNKI